MAFKKLEIATEIEADINKVWTLWTAPEHIVHWNFASEDWCCPNAENDLKKDGRFCFRMEAKDGSFGFDFEGVYDEVIPLTKISYRLEDGRQVETIFTSVENSTKINSTFEAETENPLEMQQQGWQAILNHFRNYVLSFV